MGSRGRLDDSMTRLRHDAAEGGASPSVPPPLSASGNRGGSDLSDETLLEMLRRGEDWAATALYLRYAARLRRLAVARGPSDLLRVCEPDDLLQSIFRSFFRKAVEGLYQVPEGGDLWNLFLIIALHKIRNRTKYHRSRKRDARRLRAGVDLTGIPAGEGSAAAGDDLDRVHLRITIREILDTLDPVRRAVVEMRILGHKVDEISERVNRSKRSVERMLQDFRATLTGMIDSDES